MDDRETTEYLTALAVGALLGVGAALLFRPRRSRTDRLIRELKPYRKRIQRGVSRARGAVESGAGTAAERGGALAAAGAAVLHDFRDQLVELASTARDEVADMIETQVTEAQGALKRGAKKIRS